MLVAGAAEHAQARSRPPATTPCPALPPVRTTSRSSSASAGSMRRTRASSTPSSRRPQSTTAWTSSTDFQTELPISGRPYMISSFGENELELTPNPNWWGDPPKTERILITGFADQETELGSDQLGRSRLHLPAVLPGHHRRGHRPERGSRPSPSVATTRRCTSRWVRTRPTQVRSPTPTIVMRSSGRSIVTHCSRRSTPRSSRAPNCSSAARSFPASTAPMRGPTSPTTRQAADQIMTDAGWAKNGDGFWEKRRQRPRGPLDGQHREHPA